MVCGIEVKAVDEAVLRTRLRVGDSRYDIGELTVRENAHYAGEIRVRIQGVLTVLRENSRDWWL